MKNLNFSKKGFLEKISLSFAQLVVRGFVENLHSKLDRRKILWQEFCGYILVA